MEVPSTNPKNLESLPLAAQATVRTVARKSGNTLRVPSLKGGHLVFIAGIRDTRFSILYKPQDIKEISLHAEDSPTEGVFDLPSGKVLISLSDFYMLDQKIDPTPVIVQGLGPMGKEILKAAHQDPRLNVVGVVDIDSSLVGTRLSDHGLEPGNIVISSSLEAGNTADVVLHATGSYLESVAPQIQEALTMGLNVVSTCEELSFPFVRHPSISETLDTLALDHGLTVVGTGVNPGFMMDRLPLAMASISHSIRSIQVDRVQDPTSRRRPFQVKVGMGMSTKEFEELASKGSFGHVGLEESARLIATGLGWDLEKWDHHIEPVHAETAERVNGLIETLKASTADGRTLALRFVAHSSVDECFDSIKIEGLPEIDLHIAGGVAGDDATAAAVLQAAKVIKSARTGLISVLELPLGAYKFRSQEG